MWPDCIAVLMTELKLFEFIIAGSKLIADKCK